MKGLEISFRDIEHSDAIEQNIRDKTAKLTSTFDDITGIRAVVAMPHNHSNKGKLAHVSLEIGLPGETVAITHDKQVTVEEAEIFRAMSESLDCPVPPVVASNAPNDTIQS